MLKKEFGASRLLSYWVSVPYEELNHGWANTWKSTLAHLCNREILLGGGKKVSLESEIRI